MKTIITLFLIINSFGTCPKTFDWSCLDKKQVIEMEKAKAYYTQKHEEKMNELYELAQKK